LLIEFNKYEEVNKNKKKEWKLKFNKSKTPFVKKEPVENKKDVNNFRNTKTNIDKSLEQQWELIKLINKTNNNKKVKIKTNIKIIHNKELRIINKKDNKMEQLK
jgi:hypothetical protein